MMVWSWKNLVQLTAPILLQGLQTAFFVSLLGKEGLLNVTEVALIAERKSANTSLQHKKAESSNNSWIGLGDQNVVHL